MAKTSTTAEAKEKKPAEEIVEKTKVESAKESDLDIMQKQMALMQAQLAEAMAKLETQATVSQPHVPQVLGGAKIKVINMLDYRVNLSTEPNGGGRSFVFEGYGDSRSIKFDDLENCYASYRKTFEDGWLYIADNKAVQELGLTEEYQHFYDKATVDKIILLPTENEVNMFIGLPHDLQESTASIIAEKMESGVKYDLNLINQIEKSTEINFGKLVSDIKSYQQTQ